MQITELIQSIKEEKLDKFQLENYSSQLDVLQAEMELALADLEKDEAMFLAKSEHKTRAMATIQWDATEKGQEEIELKRKLRAVSKLASSVKTRIYQKWGN